jgi:hypothetical protein
VSDRTGLSRGDRNRNVRLARLRGLVPPANAIVGIDLASLKQAAVVTDHDSRVLARRRVSARAWELGELLDWALVRARAAGFGSVTVACEPPCTRSYRRRWAPPVIPNPLWTGTPPITRHRCCQVQTVPSV